MKPAVAVAALVAAGLGVAAHLAVGDVGLNLADEGFLWLGVGRTAAGQVPMVDFQAYEPGRYWWCAAWRPLLGSGILGLRAATACFGAFGLFCGLLAVRRVVPHPWLLVPAGVLLAAWMFPHYKTFEPSLAMMAVWLGVRLLERRGPAAHLAAGAFAGVAACFGRNDGVYCGLAFLVLAVFLHAKTRQGSLGRKLGALAAGVVLGYAPMLFLLAFASGFAESLAAEVFSNVRQGVNIPLAVPWPWRFPYARLDWSQRLAAAAIGSAFLLPVLFYPCALVAAWRTDAAHLGRRAVLIASGVVGVLYAHHAAVRSDVPHLAQCIGPALIGILAVPHAFGFARRPGPALATWAVPVLVTVFAVPATHPALAAPRPLVPYTVAGDRLRLPATQAAYLAHLGALIERHVGPDAPIFIAPMRPTLYPVLGRSAPVWGLYLLVPQGRAKEERMIAELERGGVDWALVIDIPLDRREDTRFADLHPLLSRYLDEAFAPVADPDLPPAHALLRRRPSADLRPPSGSS